MKKTNTQYCLIGEDSLLIQCAEIILAKKGQICLIVSTNKKVKTWAKKYNLLFAQNINELSLILSNNQPDYIFSISNSHILPKSIFSLAKKYAINYHDSLLPKYAGLHATSWALLNDEKIHGITWHIMSDEIDKGQILKQKEFKILENDTALTLNLHCYEAAIETFQELLDDLINDRASPKHQMLENRSYYSMGHTPPNLGFIDWEESSQKIKRTYRALTFGHYKNEIGTLKIYLDSNYLIVSKLDLSDLIEDQFSKPGTILKIEKDNIHIATGTTPIKISELLSPNGDILTIDWLIKNYHLVVGQRLPVPSKRELVLAESSYSKCLLQESLKIDEIKNATEHAVFSNNGKNQLLHFNTDNIEINLKKIFPNKKIDNITETFTAAILIYLYRLNNHEKTSVSLFQISKEPLPETLASLFSQFVPFSFEPKLKISLLQVLEFCSENLIKINNNPLLISDISVRHFLSHDKKNPSGIVIDLANTLDIRRLPKSTFLIFKIDAQEGRIQIHHRFDLSLKHLVNSVMRNISTHVTNIILSLLNNNHLCLNTFSFLNEHENNKLIRDWGIGEKTFTYSVPIEKLVDRQVENSPNHTAVIFDGQSYSYQKFWKAVEKVAAYISQLELPKDAKLGILLNRSFAMLATILGILKAKKTYVPLDPHYPLSRIDTIIQDASISHIFSHQHGKDSLKEIGATIVPIEKILLCEHIKEKFTDEIDQKEHDLEKLAYIIYTSGTTSEPKGVMVSHKNVLNYCAWFLDSTQFKSSNIMDFSCSAAFDLSIPCMIAPLLVGGTIAVCDEKVKANPQKYLAHLSENQVSHVEMTPGYMHLLLNYPSEIKKLATLKYLLLGADIVSKDDVLKWMSLCPSHQLINEYGPTEATVAVTSYFIDHEAMSAFSSIPIGRPGYNTECYILDKYKNLCPIGMPGELHIGGNQVAKGYLNKPELTQEKFIAVNWVKNRETIYNTGDLTCWSPEGEIQFLGRNDKQTKIQGYRIEISEIESVLLKISCIQQAIVALKGDRSNDKYLSAYLLCNKNRPSYHRIKKFLSQYLPFYMIPKEFCIVDEIPLKENEKIDYGALLCKKAIYTEINNKQKISETRIEAKIKKIWSDIFSNQNISVEDDFFDLGGDSLTALAIMGEIKEKIGTSLNIKCIFEHPTITKLAKKIRSLRNNNDLETKTTAKNIIIPLSYGSFSAPIFLIHPVGGGVFWYKHLATLLEEKYSIFAIQDPNIDEDCLHFSTLEEMASCYLTEIDKIYGGEKLFLGGASFGATVIFEMAHQAIKQGKKIEFLGMFDGWANYPDQIMKTHSYRLTENDLAFYEKIDGEKMQDLIQKEQHRKHLLGNYKLHSLNTSMTLFKATELWSEFQAIDDPFNGWKNLFSNEIKVYAVPGNHETMFFNPNVAILASMLDKHFSSIKGLIDENILVTQQLLLPSQS